MHLNILNNELYTVGLQKNSTVNKPPQFPSWSYYKQAPPPPLPIKWLLMNYPQFLYSLKLENEGKNIPRNPY